MKKIIISFTLLTLVFLGLTTPVSAIDDLRTGISLDQNNVGGNLEIIYNSFSFRFNPKLSEEPLVADLGARYYQDQEKGFFADLFITGRRVKDLRTEIDYNAGIGYSLPIMNVFFADVAAGYTYSEYQESKFYFTAGLNFSFFNFKEEKTEAKAAKGKERIKELRKKYDWEEEIIKTVYKHEILRGMTKQQVRESWGKPDRVREQENREDWIYEKWDEEAGEYRQAIFHFIEGKLNHWDTKNANIQ